MSRARQSGMGQGCSAALADDSRYLVQPQRPAQSLGAARYRRGGRKPLSSGGSHGHDGTPDGRFRCGEGARAGRCA